MKGPRGVSVEEAIRWGKARSNRVLVRLGGDELQYSAGASVVRGPGTSEWPESGLSIRARPEGSAIDGSEQLVEWRARLVLDSPVGLSQRIAGLVSSKDQMVRVTSVGDTAFEVVLLAKGSQDAAELMWTAVSTAYVAASGDREGYAPASISDIMPIRPD